MTVYIWTQDETEKTCDQTSVGGAGSARGVAGVECFRFLERDKDMVDILTQRVIAIFKPLL